MKYAWYVDDNNAGEKYPGTAGCGSSFKAFQTVLCVKNFMKCLKPHL